MSKELLRGAEFIIKESEKGNIFTPEDFNEEQKQIARTAEQFVMNEIVPHLEKIDEQHFEYVVEGFKKCGELGLLMLDAPEEFDGLEMDKATNMLVSEKLAPGGSFLVAYAAHTGIGTLPLLYYGTNEQKQKYLPKLISGEWVGAYALTEPDAGSDALGIRATAVLSEDKKYYILNGTKQFITNAGFAQLFTVFAKINGQMTAFLVERDFEGVELGIEEKKLGIKGSSTRQVILNNAKVPVENVLGEIGKGHKIAFNILNVGRFKLGAAAVGASKYALQTAIKYANERTQFGKPIGSFGAIKEKIARELADIYAAESLIYRLAGTLDEKLATVDKSVPNYYEEYQKAIEEYSIECAIAKVFCSDVLGDVVDEVVQIFGGYGYVAEYPAERFYRDERINRIFEGTNEINRLVVTGMMLRKAMKGELPLQKEALKAFEKMMTPSFEEIDTSAPYALEREHLKNLKTIFLAIAGAGVKKYMDKIADEQEIVMALADMAIGIYAIESAVLRAEKMLSNDKVLASKKELAMSAVKVFTFYQTEKIAQAAKKAIYFMEEGDTLIMLLSGLRRFTKYDATGLLKHQRFLADTALSEDKYIFRY